MSAHRVIYCYPDELVEIRVIRDSELPKNAAEWGFQVRPPKQLVKIAREGEIGVISLNDVFHWRTNPETK